MKQSEASRPGSAVPDLQLPLVPWLSAAPIACLLMGGIGYAVSLALGVQQPIGAVFGGVSTACAMLLAATAVLPWMARPLNQWANLLLGGQLLAIVLTLAVGWVMWRAVGTEAAPLGLTAAAAFLVGQLVQVSVFQSAARPVEKRFREERAAQAS